MRIRSEGCGDRFQVTSSNRLALSLILLGVMLTTLSFYRLQTEKETYPTTTPAFDTRLENLSGWVPPPPVQQDQVAAAVQPVSSAPIVRVGVPRVGINARVEILSLDAAGVMQDPKKPDMVAWYDFSARPGQLGNVVIAGHVDYINYGPAVFWRLRDLKPGDRIEVELADGTLFAYDVETLNYYDVATAPVKEITGPTPYEAITLITCGGSFNRSNLSYNQRLIVRATRTTTTASSP
jgi:LPXTG-site transpeptidase (sortase) family protein